MVFSGIFLSFITCPVRGRFPDLKAFDTDDMALSLTGSSRMLIRARIALVAQSGNSPAIEQNFAAYYFIVVQCLFRIMSERGFASESTTYTCTCGYVQTEAMKKCPKCGGVCIERIEYKNPLKGK